MRRWLAVILCVLSVACSDDETGPEPIQIPGSYTLQTVNGQALPVQIGEVMGAYFLFQRAGTVTLNPDRTYLEHNDLQEIFNDAQLGIITNDFSSEFRGTWESQDSAVLMRETEHGFTSFGYVSENRLTLSFEVGDSLFTFVYRRN